MIYTTTAFDSRIRVVDTTALEYYTPALPAHKFISISRAMACQTLRMWRRYGVRITREDKP